ncbi:TonB-dependent receptor [Sphingomonas sp. So64.6b]|uniref:TonB-dependent receptor n=1 Tax=Sphingomonas sp. So64.6b TaxID=2997354 RepID=UPI001603D3D8|nr:TonB-dependent receptor [Sphingomonas sp. So64.6b]QNA84357.1 TonB-dependent receptor [Sphingomonas sp. So64.6b]
MISHRRTVTRLGVSVLALCTAAAAHAQSEPPAASQAESVPAGDDSQGDIVVTGQRASQERALDAKRQAIGILDVAAADEIGRLPDRNVSEVVEHLPGVGVTYDQGEGRYVSIRGVPSNLNNYTLNGIEIGNPDGTTRSLPLDIVSGQLLNRVEVAKVKTADMDGQGIGGTINLVTQTAFDFKDSFSLSASGKAGYQQLNHKVPVQGDLSIATRFGADEQFGLVLGASYSNRDFVSEGFYPDNWRPDSRFAGGGVPDNIKYTEYSLDRRRLGATGSFDWRPSDTQTFYIRGIYSKFIEDEIRPRYRLDFATPAIANGPGFTVNPDGVTGTATTGTERREDLRLDYKAKWLATGIIGGSTELGKLKFAYEGAYSRNETLDQFPIWQFRCNPGTVNFDLTNPIYTATPVTECTANQMQFRQYTYSHQLNTEKIWQGKVDATYDLDGGSFLKFGAKYRNTDRDFDQDNPTYVRGAAANRWTLGQFGLGGPATCVYPNSQNTGQCYSNGPTFNIDALNDFTDQNLGGALMPLDPVATRANNTLADFQLKERVAAGYAMANLKFGAVTVTPGLRYERTSLDITGYQLLNNNTLNPVITPVSRKNDYGDWLPSLVVRITPSDDTIFRLAYSRSLGRPEYSNLSPGGSISMADGAVSLGNPDLKPYRADNLDAMAEWYFARGGILSIGVFAKFIKNPIFGGVTVLHDTTYNGVFYQTLSISQPFNADKGDIIGIEAQYQQQFTFLPGLLSGFGIQLNGTLTGSTLTLQNGRSSTFPSQSKYLYGAELFYQKGPLEASVAYHNTGHALLAVGDVWYNDQYNDDLRRLDAKVSFALLKNVTLFAEAQNLTDEPTRQYQGGNPDWIIQNERYGRTFYGGVSVKF